MSRKILGAYHPRSHVASDVHDPIPIHQDPGVRPNEEAGCKEPVLVWLQMSKDLSGLQTHASPTQHVPWRRTQTHAFSPAYSSNTYECHAETCAMARASEDGLIVVSSFVSCRSLWHNGALLDKLAV